MRLTLLFALAACSPRIIRVPVNPNVMQVEIVKVPDIGGCYLPDMPETPEQLFADSSIEPDVFKRMYIHRREFEELLEHMRWWRHWAEYIERCLKDKLNLP